VAEKRRNCDSVKTLKSLRLKKLNVYGIFSQTETFMNHLLYATDYAVTIAAIKLYQS